MNELEAERLMRAITALEAILDILQDRPVPLLERRERAETLADEEGA